jgi:hypothetical protein
MNFLQPWMLLALPLAAIPIIIHLVNQRRFQTVPWAAMRFLLDATKMSSGYTKLRQWLILAMRTLALAALILFTARPLTSGLLALLGGDANRVAIVLLDRSPSMAEIPNGALNSKLEQGIDQLAETFKTLGIQRIVQIDPLAEKPEEFPSVTQWLRAAPRDAWSATSDIPGQLEKALLYAKNNPSGNTMVWLCSDMRDSDWKSQDGRWKGVQDGFRALGPSIRFSILDLSQNDLNPTAANRSIRTTEVRRVEAETGPELALSLRIEQPGPSSPVQGTAGNKTTGNNSGDKSVDKTTENTVNIPVEITVGSNRSVVEVPMQGNSAQLTDYRIPLEKDFTSDANAGSTKTDPAARGFGSVRIPSDSNPSDDTAYFVFEPAPARRALLISETPELVQAIELCASISPEQSVRCEAELASLSQFESTDLSDVALIVWQENLPTGKSLETLSKFVASGGQLLLLPPENPDQSEAFGVQWSSWEALDASEAPVGNAAAPVNNSESTDNLEGNAGNAQAGSDRIARIAQWQNDSQLLSNTLNGAPLPIGQLGIRRLCGLNGNLEPLATLPSGKPFLASVTLSAEQALPIMLCATTPSDRDSTLAGDGVVLYVTIQRLLAIGASRVGTTRNALAGTDHRAVDASSKMSLGNDEAPSNEYPMHAGVYATDETLVAIHRDETEDLPRVVETPVLERLFGDLAWAKISASKKASSLVQEVWRWFVVAMLMALLLEALLCLPKVNKKRPSQA